MGSTITGKITKTVTLGVGGYSGTLSISSTGSIVPTAYGSDALVSEVSGADITNNGFLQAAVSNDEGNSIGILLKNAPGTISATLTNGDVIEGGYGGNGGGTGVGYGYNGGYGVYAGNDVTINNHGLIQGGAGGYGSLDFGGNGGVGLAMNGPLSRLSNTFESGFPGIVGGNGGGSFYFGGYGGAGVSLSFGATATNASVIAGGDGGFSRSGSRSGTGGDGVSSDPSSYFTLTNAANGRISGGAGGEAEGSDLAAGNGGAGVFCYSNGTTLLNDGLINGGTGGASANNFVNGTAASAGNGGDGVYLRGRLDLSNAGTIVGGLGGAGGYGASHPGIGLTISGFDGRQSATASNSGLIAGGAGRDGSYLSLTAGGLGAEGGFSATLYNTGTIEGGAGGSEPNAKFGLHGGNGVEIAGGLLINAGRIEVGAPGNGGSTADSYAVLFSAKYAGTLEVLPGASFEGNVAAVSGLADVLVLGGDSSATLSGIGTQFTNFSVLSFASGAAWSAAGDAAGLASLAQIDGFVTGDKIVIDGFTEANVGALGFANGVLTLENANTYKQLSMTFGTTLTDDMLITDGGGNTTLSMVAKTSKATLGAGDAELIGDGGTANKMTVISGGIAVASGGALSNSTVQDGSINVLSGGTASHIAVGSGSLFNVFGGAANTTIEAGGFAYFHEGVVASNTTLAGGQLDLLGHATLKGGFEFTGTGGELVLDTNSLPTVVISGFTVGDEIILTHPAATSGTVSITSNGTLVIAAGGDTYKLKIAGAVAGEDNFTFSNGALTETSPSMAFQRPAASVAPATGVIPELVNAGGYQTVRARQSGPISASSPMHGLATNDLFRIPNGGIQAMITLQS